MAPSTFYCAISQKPEVWSVCLLVVHLFIHMVDSYPLWVDILKTDHFSKLKIFNSCSAYFLNLQNNIFTVNFKSTWKWLYIIFFRWSRSSRACSWWSPPSASYSPRCPHSRSRTKTETSHVSHYLILYDPMTIGDLFVTNIGTTIQFL